MSPLAPPSLLSAPGQQTECIAYWRRCRPSRPSPLRGACGGQDARATAPDRRVDPAALAGRHKGRASKEERLARVHEGREGREFGAASARKKQKTGGTSNRQKARRPWLAARGPGCTLRSHTEGASGRERSAVCNGMFVLPAMLAQHLFALVASRVIFVPRRDRRGGKTCPWRRARARRASAPLGATGAAARAAASSSEGGRRAGTRCRGERRTALLLVMCVGTSWAA